MSRLKNLKTIPLLVFVIIQLALTIAIFFIDLKGNYNTTWIKYGCIILCFIFSCFAFKTKKGFLITGAMAGTLLADYFLLIRDDNYTLGISSFIIVQAIYFLYLKPKHWKISLIIRSAIFLAILSILLKIKIDDVSAYFAGFYFTNLIMNMTDSWIGGKKNILMSLGLLLFIGCDLSVGLNNLSSYISYSSSFIDALVRFSDVGMWLFYVPSQTLIVLSVFYPKDIGVVTDKQNM
ncbi:MAG: hypothetical protein MJ241_03825 [Bacilli bacterium]|nr:hypothetical protein [Bacilli bacterium]